MLLHPNSLQLLTAACEAFAAVAHDGELGALAVIEAEALPPICAALEQHGRRDGRLRHSALSTLAVRLPSTRQSYMYSHSNQIAIT